jgi:hypothetical protein
MKRNKPADSQENLVQEFVKDKAERSVRQLLDEIKVKVSRDVEARLRHLEAPGEGESRGPAPVDKSRYCGRSVEESGELASGLDKLFEQYWFAAGDSLKSGQFENAIDYLNRCFLLPRANNVKMRETLVGVLEKARTALQRERSIRSP